MLARTRFVLGLRKTVYRPERLHTLLVRAWHYFYYQAANMYIYLDPTCALLPPHRISEPLEPGLGKRIIVSLATRFDKPVATIKKYFKPDEVDQWAKVERLEGGDRMLASSMLTSLEDRRDATFVRVRPISNFGMIISFISNTFSSTLFSSTSMPSASDSHHVTS